MPILSVAVVCQRCGLAGPPHPLTVATSTRPLWRRVLCVDCCDLLSDRLLEVLASDRPPDRLLEVLASDRPPEPSSRPELEEARRQETIDRLEGRRSA